MVNAPEVLLAARPMSNRKGAVRLRPRRFLNLWGCPLTDTIADTVVGSLDMASDKDRGVLRRCLDDGSAKSKRPRWPSIDDETKSRYVKALNIALSISLRKEDQRGINGCVKTLAMLEGQNQADEHLDEKYARLDSGKATETVNQLHYIKGIDPEDV